METNRELGELIDKNKDLASRLFSAGIEAENVEQEKSMELIVEYKKISQQLVIGYINLALQQVELLQHSRIICLNCKELLYLAELANTNMELAHQYDEKNKITDKLVNKKNELQKSLQLNSDRELFITTLAHDLRSPFCALLGLSELLSENVSKKNFNEIKLLADLIYQSSHETFFLLEDLLTWIKFQSDKVTFNPQKVAINDICKNTYDTFKSFADSKKITINCHNIDSIDVFADVSMLKGIFRNLMSNAIKFTNTEGHIDITSKKEDGYVVIMISDNGIGIHSEQLLNLFEKSQNSTTPGTAGELGTGLGLILCKQFLEKHNGNIWVDSEHGKGTKFSFTLPIFSEKAVS